MGYARNWLSFFNLMSSLTVGLLFLVAGMLLHLATNTVFGPGSWVLLDVVLFVAWVMATTNDKSNEWSPSFFYAGLGMWIHSGPGGTIWTTLALLMALACALLVWWNTPITRRDIDEFHRVFG